MQPTILPELKALLPQLSKEERAALKNSLKAEGQREAIITWRRPDNTVVIVEGHNRFELLNELGIKPQYEERDDWKTIDQVKDWMFQNALARRNLPPKWLQYIIGKEYLEKKKAPFEANGTVGQIDPRTGKPERTSAEVARKHKVSEATVRRAAKVAQKVDKEAAGSHAKKAEILNSKRTKAKKKPGFDHKLFDKNFGWISRQVDVYAEKQGHTGTALHKNCNKALSIFRNQWEAMVKKDAKASIKLA